MTVTAPPMSAAPPRPFIGSDLDEIEDGGYRYEVIEGRLIVNPTPISRHQNAVVKLTYLFESRCPPGFKVMVAPLDWRPPTGDSLQPDLMVIRKEDYNPEGFQLATPQLVVEVLSPSSMTYDRHDKRARYEMLGVPSYWIVDASIPSLTALQLTDGCYVEVAQVSGSDAYKAALPYHVAIAPGDLVL